MKYICCSLGLLAWVSSAMAQKAPTLPSNTNQFIMAPNITWAAELRDDFSFSNARTINGVTIYRYLFNKAWAGKLKMATDSFKGFATFNQSQSGAYADRKMAALPMFDTAAWDPQQQIALHEMFYLENYLLRSHIIAASPLVSVVTTSGINLGMKDCFYCCGTPTSATIAPNISRSILLQTVTRTIDPDSMPELKQLKQTFGMHLAQTLWYGASQKSGTMTDMIAGKKIAANEVMSYTFGESVVVPVYDSSGNISGHKKMTGPSPFDNGLLNKIELEQDIYFNPQLHTFSTITKACYFFVKYWNNNTNSMDTEKRFKLIFRKAAKK